MENWIEVILKITTEIILCDNSQMRKEWTKRFKLRSNDPSIKSLFKFIPNLNEGIRHYATLRPRMTYIVWYGHRQNLFLTLETFFNNFKTVQELVLL